MLKIIIIEDNVNDLMWYRPIFSIEAEVSFLFYNKDENYTKEKLEFVDKHHPTIQILQNS